MAKKTLLTSLFFANYLKKDKHRNIYFYLHNFRPSKFFMFKIVAAKLLSLIVSHETANERCCKYLFVISTIQWTFTEQSSVSNASESELHLNHMGVFGCCDCSNKFVLYLHEFLNDVSIKTRIFIYKFNMNSINILEFHVFIEILIYNNLNT